jgi:peptidoglycan/LPS O-acetylase OafA/YrhL
MSQSRRHISGLDGLRALSILIVVLSHVITTQGFPASLARVRDLEQGGFGVTIFFAISGYLITRLLLDEEQRAGTISIRGFYYRRAFRILPAAFAYLGFMALLNVAWRPIVPLREIGIAAFFGENLWGKNVLVLHYWSLSIEEQFYLVWPAILFFCPRKHLLHVVLAWIALAPLWFHLNLKLLGATEVNVSRPDLCADRLLTGVAIALAERDPIGTRVLAWVRARATWVFPVALVGASAYAVGSQHASSGFVVLPLQLARDVLIAALLYSATCQAEGATSRILEAPLVRFLGRLSYSLYLWQQLFLMGRAWPPGDAPWFARFPMNLAYALAAACASYYLVEQPILRWRDRRSAKGVSALAQPGTSGTRQPSAPTPGRG